MKHIHKLTNCTFKPEVNSFGNSIENNNNSIPTIDRLRLTQDRSKQILYELKAPQKSVPKYNQLRDFISQPLPIKIPLQRKTYNRLLEQYSLVNSVMDQLSSETQCANAQIQDFCCTRRDQL